MSTSCLKPFYTVYGYHPCGYCVMCQNRSAKFREEAKKKYKLRVIDVRKEVDRKWE